MFPHNFSQFEEVSSEINNKYGSFIERKDIALVTGTHHFRTGYILGKKPDIPELVYAGQPTNVAELDDIEKGIIRMLTRNSRITIVETAQRLKTPAKTISYRIEKLRTDNIIEGYTTTIDYGRIGFERYKVLIQTKNMTQRHERTFTEYCRMHPYGLYYSTYIGSNDVELEFIVITGNHLREIIADIRNRFKDVIKSYEILKIYNEYKLNYYPSEV